MAEEAHPYEPDAHVAMLVERAIQEGVPSVIAADAARRTLHAVSGTPSPTMAVRRADGYFWTVVRRKLVRQRRGADATARFVLASVVDDLLASGRDGHAVWAELERGWSDKVPPSVLEEFRLRMCA